MDLPLELETHDDLIVVRLKSEVSTYVLDELKTELCAAVREAGIYRVLINLSSVDYITSKDLGVFVQIFRFLTDEQKEITLNDPDLPVHDALLAFSNLDPFITDLMKMTKLETIFRIFETEETGIESLCTGKSEPSD